MPSPTPRCQRDPDAFLTLGRSLEELGRLAGWLGSLGSEHRWSQEFVHTLNLALEEWFVNVISYAFADTSEHAIHFRLWIEGGRLIIEIEDDGRPFDPTACAAPDMSAKLHEREIGGLGIHFIRRVMDDMNYRRQGECNHLTLFAHIGNPSR